MPGPLDTDADRLVSLFRAGRLDEALALSAEVAADATTRILGLNIRARCLHLLGRSDEAARFIREHADELEQSGDAWMTLAHCHEESDDVASRVHALRHACELGPTADRLTLLGVALAQRGDQEAAARELRRAMELDPSHSEAHANFAFYIVGGSARTRAEALYRRAIELDPENRFAVEQLGLCLWCDSARHDEAERVLHQVVGTASATALARAALADLLWRRGANREARELYLRTVDEDSSFVALLAGEFFTAQGEFEPAERIFLQALRREESAELLWQYGRMLRQAGQVDLGDILVRRAHRLAPEDVRIAEDL